MLTLQAAIVAKPLVLIRKVGPIYVIPFGHHPNCNGRRFLSDSPEGQSRGAPLS